MILSEVCFRYTYIKYPTLNFKTTYFKLYLAFFTSYFFLSFFPKENIDKLYNHLDFNIQS